MPYEAVQFPIGGQNVYRGLIVQYIGIAAYATLAVIFGAQTVGQATGPIYGFVFPIALFLSALAALWGVVRSRYTRQIWVEYTGTLLLLAGLAGYAGAIIYAGISLGEHWRFPGALLPLCICVFPVLRGLNILKVVRAQAALRALAKKAKADLAKAVA